MTHVRDISVVESALTSSDRGMTDADNAALHGVSIKTIRRWRRLYQRQGIERGQRHLTATCPRCDSGSLDHSAYAELLGWYLGDGHLTKARGDVYSLHVVNDARYTALSDRVCQLIRRVKPASRPHMRERPGAVVITVGWKHWPCLFPQHGPGRKHERALTLEPWQRAIITEHPEAFLRGLFHSDGCRVTNQTSRTTTTGVRRYEYGRWFFSNESADIMRWCQEALDLLGIPWRMPRRNALSVATRAGVADLDRFVGPNS